MPGCARIVWESTLGREAAGRTLGIIGLGRIGRQTAMLARKLDMQVWRMTWCTIRSLLKFKASATRVSARYSKAPTPFAFMSR